MVTAGAQFGVILPLVSLICAVGEAAKGTVKLKYGNLICSRTQLWQQARFRVTKSAHQFDHFKDIQVNGS